MNEIRDEAKPLAEDNIPACCNCMHWGNWYWREGWGAWSGLCRYNPPTADLENREAVWPSTMHADWCREYTVTSWQVRYEGHHD